MTVGHALLDILQGRFEDGASLGERSEPDELMRSIRDHLARLLNTRAGSLQHMPSFGMPDLASVYEGLPYSTDDLAMAVQQLVTRYEPRLAHVQVQVSPVEHRNCVVSMQIAGLLADGSFGQFQSYFQTGGSARISEAGVRSSHARVF